MFAGRADMKIIDNSADPIQEWKSSGAGSLTAASSDVPSGNHPLLVSFKEGVSLLVRASAHLIIAAPMPSLPEVERKHGKKEHLQKRVHLLTEGELVRERGTNLQAAITPGMAYATTSELDHKWMVGPTLASPPEGFFVVVKGDSLVEPDPSSEDFFGLSPLEGTLQVIDLKEERDVSLL
ncbi:hypothetical protein ACLOJK_039234, partial [Asimina triloba]